MKRVVAVGVFALIFVAGLVAAQAPNEVRSAPVPDERGTFMVPGMGTCGDWYAERRYEGKYSWQGEVAWVQGFIAGHNAYVRPPANSMIRAEPNDVALWLDSYCLQNPTKTIAEAAGAFAEANGGRNAFTPRK